MRTDNQQLAKVGNAQAASRDEFLRLIDIVRPKLHLYCTRMSGSVVDGEDIVQETLASAFYKLQNLQDPSKLEPWLFSIAHNKSIDWLRRRKTPSEQFDEEEFMEDQTIQTSEPSNDIQHAVRILVTQLPPKERACIILKDMMDTPLEAIAGIVDSTTGGVKSALHRGRSKLNKLAESAIQVDLKTNERDLIKCYLNYFNNQDWDGVESLLRADATLELVGIKDIEGRDVIKDNYFVNYQNWRWKWKLELALVDGEEMIVHYRLNDQQAWSPHAVIKLNWLNGKVTTVRDYIHIDYLLCDAAVSKP